MIRISRKIILCGLTALLASIQLFAAPVSAPIAAPINLPDLTFTGYVDTSYNYLARKNVFTSGRYSRGNDIEPNGFTLQQVAFTLANQPRQGLGGLLNMIAGRDANSLADAGQNPYFGSQTLAIQPEQVYLQYAISQFTFLGGKFNSLAGYESFDPTQNDNFSFSELNTFAEPGTVIGFRGSYAALETLTLSAGLDNGWDTFHHASRLQTLELGSQWTPNKILSMTIDFYSGKQYLYDSLSNGPVGIRNYANFFATLNATGKLKFALDASYAIQSKGLLPNQSAGRVAWSGLTGYITYHLTERWFTSVRSDLFDDGNGFRTGVRQCLKELTVTLGFKPFKQLLLRAETRRDFSNQNSFVNNNTVSASNNLQSFAIEGLYIFS